MAQDFHLLKWERKALICNQNIKTNPRYSFTGCSEYHVQNKAFNGQKIIKLYQKKRQIP